MARGILAGVLSGGVISVAVLGVTSVMAPPVAPPEVSDAAPGAVTPAQAAEDNSGKAPSQPDDTPALTASTQPAAAPDPDTLKALSDEAQTPAAQPTAGPADNLRDPARAEQSAQAPEPDAPVLPSPQANAPAQPQVGQDVVLKTETAPPPSPSVAPQQLAQTPTTDETAPALPETDQGQTAAEAPSLSDAPGGDTTLSADATVPAAPIEPAAEPDTDQATDQTTPPAPAPAAPPRTASLTVPQITDETEPSAPATPPTVQTSDTQVAAASGPSVGKPATSLLDRPGAVVINRPQITEAADEAAPAQADSLPTLAGPAENSAPIDAHAQAFDVTPDKPLMSIVLIDDGSTPTAGAAGIAALRSFPYPLSFAVDSAQPDAPQRMALYRDSGFEVLAMINLPAGAQPVDAETALNAILPGLPQVVGVLEGTDTGFQETRELADQVSGILAQTGHGLLTQARGLNTMAKLARKSGVPAAPIFRDFDSKDQTATVIRRFLDQAAFRAGQEGAVVMLGRMRPDTISALLLWGLQDRASTVDLAPISVVLKYEP